MSKKTRMTEEKKIKKESIGTKERIRDLSLELFSQKGFSAVSVRDIARSVGIHESTIYSHYKGKEDIMNSIIEFLIEYYKTMPNTVSIDDLLEKQDPEVALNNTIRPMIEQLKIPQIRKILRLMWIELYHNDKILDFFKYQFIGPSHSFWADIFQKMMSKGHIIECDPQQLAAEYFDYCIYLFFEGFILNYNETAQDEVIDDLLSNLTKHVSFIFNLIKKKES
ncbi:MAG: TetR/AcrR family transcriptional regulator [Candidatus Lokiarchaeota archaeon]|nr:TetR/AcrR family transcriptional regulator [Candidatus Lokiarchaeota archaeon]